jgi:phosphatidate cytidylyltransferase
MTAAARWDDLSTRLASGAVIACVGLAIIWQGGYWLMALGAAAAGLMVWEAAAMTAPDHPWRARLAGVASGIGFLWAMVDHDPIKYVVFGIALIPAILPGCRDRIGYGAAAAAIMLSAYGFVAFRWGFGLGFVLWLVALVVIVDALGYFGGRLIGGPKFWPRISPKKTWAGILSGWAGAIALGAMLWAAGQADWTLVPFSALTAFASQMGDIGESALKRRAGVKDASALIPGHGGVMDRFDGLSGAILFVLAWAIVMPVPAVGA